METITDDEGNNDRYNSFVREVEQKSAQYNSEIREIIADQKNEYEKAMYGYGDPRSAAEHAFNFFEAQVILERPPEVWANDSLTPDQMLDVIGRTEGWFKEIGESHPFPMYLQKQREFWESKASNNE